MAHDRADQILVVEHGRITQRGTYDDRLRQEGTFRRLAHDLEAPA
jgi:ABC-type multidrug transport system fused ATPase/permease subunit